MRNRKRVLANLTHRAALGIAIWNIPSQVIALAPPPSKHQLLRQSSSPPRLNRIGEIPVNNSTEPATSIPTLPFSPSIFPVADEDPRENIPAAERWMPRTSSRTNSTSNSPPSNNPSSNSPPINSKSHAGSNTNPPPVSKPNPVVANSRTGELNWANPGVSTPRTAEVAPPSPSATKPSAKGIPPGPATPPSSSTTQLPESKEFSSSALQPPSLKRVPTHREDAKNSNSDGMEARATRGDGLEAHPTGDDGLEAHPTGDDRLEAHPTGDDGLEAHPTGDDRLDARPSAEIVEPSVTDEDVQRSFRPIGERSTTNGTSRIPSSRRGRDRGDDPGGERSEPSEIAADEKLHDVEISIDGSGPSRSTGPKLSAPTKKSAKFSRTEQEQPLVIRPEVQRLKQPLADCLRSYYRRPEDMAKRSPWGTFHSVLPFGVDGKVISGKRTYNGIAWLCGNNPCRGQKLLSIDRQGQLKAVEGVGLQGHQAQFLAILGQLGVPAEYPIYVGNKRFTVADLIRSEQMACKDGSELTFTLIGLSSFLPTDSMWRASDGETWNFERLIREELKQPIVGAACGGTHRLMGFSYSLRQRRLEGLPIEGQWVRSQQYVEDMWAYAWEMQNPDGSFSTEWLAGRADNRDLDRKVQTSGHILEWLVFTGPGEQLQDERTLRAVKFLLTTLTQDSHRSFEVGPKGHSLRALQLFYTRVFNEQQPWLQTTVAQRPSARR